MLFIIFVLRGTGWVHFFCWDISFAVTAALKVFLLALFRIECF